MRYSATNLDKDTFQVEIDLIIIKGLTDKNYKISNKDILHLTEEPPNNEVHFAFDNDLEENQASSLSPAGSQETAVSNFEENLSNSLPLIGSQTTPIIQPKSDDLYSLKSHYQKEFNDINTKIMALKTFFMDEIYALRQDLSSMQQKYHQTIMLIENNNICTKDSNTVDELQVKLQFLEKENLSLKEEAKHKQNIMQNYF